MARRSSSRCPWHQRSQQRLWATYVLRISLRTMSVPQFAQKAPRHGTSDTSLARDRNGPDPGPSVGTVRHRTRADQQQKPTLSRFVRASWLTGRDCQPKGRSRCCVSIPRHKVRCCSLGIVRAVTHMRLRTDWVSWPLSRLLRTCMDSARPTGSPGYSTPNGSLRRSILVARHSSPET